MEATEENLHKNLHFSLEHEKFFFLCWILNGYTWRVLIKATTFLTWEA